MHNSTSSPSNSDSPNTTKRRQCKSLDLATKFHIIDLIENGERKSKLAKRYGIAPSTVSTIWRNKNRIKDIYYTVGLKSVQMKRSRNCTYEDIEKAMLEWLNALRDTNLTLNGPVLKEKALSIAKSLNIAEFKASDGWLTKFKSRHNITMDMLSGEDASGNQEDVKEWTEQLLSILSDYQANDVFNVDETEISYKCPPMDEKCFGGKCCKDTVTCVVGTNANGTEKLKLLVVGKKPLPDGFEAIKSLPVEYTTRNRRFLTEDIFTSWLVEQDKQFASAKRKVLFFIDNCPVNLEKVHNQLEAITLKYFPCYVTKNVQPLHVGIINSLKLHYRHRILKKNVCHWQENRENYEISLVDFLRELWEAWMQDVTSPIITDCFKKVGFKMSSGWHEECDPLFIKDEPHSRSNSRIDKMSIGDDTDSEGASDRGNPTGIEVEAAIKTLQTAIQSLVDVPDDIHQCLNTIETFFKSKKKSESNWK